MKPEVVSKIKGYIEGGGTAFIIPESFIFDQYARENNKIGDLGIIIKDIFKNNPVPLTFISDGLVQTIENGGYEVLARFEDGNAAITLAQIGDGEFYYLVYASNLTFEPVEFDLRSEKEIGTMLDLRNLHEIADGHIKLGPYQETIFKIEKKR